MSSLAYCSHCGSHPWHEKQQNPFMKVSPQLPVMAACSSHVNLHKHTHTHNTQTHAHERERDREGRNESASTKQAHERVHTPKHRRRCKYMFPEGICHHCGFASQRQAFNQILSAKTQRHVPLRGRDISADRRRLRIVVDRGFCVANSVAVRIVHGIARAGVVASTYSVVVVVVQSVSRARVGARANAVAVAIVEEISRAAVDIVANGIAVRIHWAWCIRSTCAGVQRASSR